MITTGHGPRERRGSNPRSAPRSNQGEGSPARRGPLREPRVDGLDLPSPRLRGARGSALRHRRSEAGASIREVQMSPGAREGRGSSTSSCCTAVDGARTKGLPRDDAAATHCAAARAKRSHGASFDELFRAAHPDAQKRGRTQSTSARNRSRATTRSERSDSVARGHSLSNGRTGPLQWLVATELPRLQRASRSPQDRFRCDCLQARSLLRRDSIIVRQADGRFSEDSSVEHAGHQVCTHPRRMAAIRGPQK
jgi:hypothetical protein